MTSTSFDNDIDYVRRSEEDRIRDEVTAVRRDGRSRAVLVYGDGGVGKTTLVQQLVTDGHRHDDQVTWVPRIDVDDSEFWLLSNLETAIARAVDDAGGYFSAYLDDLSKLPRFADQRTDYESVLSYLGRTNRVFVDCYREFVRATGRTVVVVLDTVEAIRDTYLLLTLVQWMKQLPSTLFVLAGRPVPERDLIARELDEPHQPLAWTRIDLEGFTDAEAAQFLSGGPLGEALTPEQRSSLVTLTGGQPLWLALAEEYLRRFDLPPEMLEAPDQQRRGDPNFRRRLVTPYRGSDFWSETTKRLAVVRHSVDKEVWRRLMADRQLPSEVTSWDDAWEQLLRRRFVRVRANKRYVTLHDALAEELAQHMIPLHDQEEKWRRWLWARAREVYTELTPDEPDRILKELHAVARALETADPPQQEALLQRLVQVDAEKRQIDQLLNARLHYELLDDSAVGTQRFLELYKGASERRDPLLMELICHEVERFLPDGEIGDPLKNVLNPALTRFRKWLFNEAPDRYTEIAIRIAAFLIENDQAASALDLLRLTEIAGAVETPDELRYQLANDRGNACMRIPDRIREAEGYFVEALTLATGLDDSERVLRTAEAHKELGYYYRNLGQWADADRAYEKARAVIARVMGPGSDERDRQEMASIQTNWAYLKALRGAYREARNLVDSAISICDRLGQRQREGIARSVSGEVFRYEGKLVRAWAEYKLAEDIFHELKSWPWLGVIYQEQAICLYQARQEGSFVIDGQETLAVDLIKQAMDLCRDSSSRNYPSALNRAGRIFATTDVDGGIQHLDYAITEAQRIGDGWFYSSSLIEYVEMCYAAWQESGEADYRTKIANRAAAVAKATETYGFTDLHGRWQILQGHLLVADAVDEADHRLDEAISRYASGFLSLAAERVGSHGSVAVGDEFAVFKKLFKQRSPTVQRRWYLHLLEAWSNKRATLLLARLEELY